MMAFKMCCVLYVRMFFWVRGDLSQLQIKGNLSHFCIYIVLRNNIVHFLRFFFMRALSMIKKPRQAPIN